MARLGAVWYGRQGVVGPGAARLGQVGLGVAVMARRDEVGFGMAR